MSAQATTPPQISDSDRFWAQAAEARLRALPKSLSVSNLAGELASSRRAHETFEAILTHRMWMENGRLGRIPAEILALIFSWLTVLDPLGEVDFDDESSYCGTGESAGAGQFEDELEGENEDDQSDSDSAWSPAPSVVSEDISCAAYTIGWVRVTWVCHLWREIALSNPSLWSRIPMHLPRPWINALVQRSKNVPLAIEYNGEDLGALPLVAHGTQMFGRARSIMYHGSPAHRLGHLLDRFVTPNLEHLEINNTGEVFHAVNLHPSKWKLLKSLEVSHIDHLPRCSRDSTYAHLTDLRIGTFAYTLRPHYPELPRIQSIPTAEQFLDFIGSLKNVENVELIGCLPTVAPAPTLEYEVFLPRLRRVALTETPVGCSVFLRHVVSPQDMVFHVDYLDVLPDRLEDLALESYAPRARLHTLSISCNHYAQAYVYGTNSSVSEGTILSSNPPLDKNGELGIRGAHSGADLSIMLTPLQNQASTTRWIRALPLELCKNISLSTVQCLHLDLEGSLGLSSWSVSQDDSGQPIYVGEVPVWDATLWTGLLRPVYILRCLRVVSCPTKDAPWCSVVVDLLQALRSLNELLPQLQLLELIDLDPDLGPNAGFTLHALDSGDYYVDRDPASPDASDLLRQVLQMRPTLNITLIRRQFKDFKRKWKERDWVVTGESENRVHFAVHAFIA